VVPRRSAHRPEERHHAALALKFDQMTLAALPAAVLLVLAAVFYVGMADAEVPAWLRPECS